MTDAAPLAMFDPIALEPTVARREANGRLQPDGYEPHWWPCVLCSRPMDPDAPGALWVRMAETGDFYPSGTSDEDVAASGHGDMGSHPIGASCARKVPKAYRTSGTG